MPRSRDSRSSSYLVPDSPGLCIPPRALRAFRQQAARERQGYYFPLLPSCPLPPPAHSSEVSPAAPTERKYMGQFRVARDDTFVGQFIHAQLRLLESVSILLPPRRRRRNCPVLDNSAVASTHPRVELSRHNEATRRRGRGRGSGSTGGMSAIHF